MVSIEIVPRSKGLKSLSTDELEVDSTVEQLLILISKTQNISKDRIRLTMKDAAGKQVPLDANKTFGGNGISKTTNSLTLYTKDLGPQIAWRTVFIIEYFGPLFSSSALLFVQLDIWPRLFYSHPHSVCGICVSVVAFLKERI